MRSIFLVVIAVFICISGAGVVDAGDDVKLCARVVVTAEGQGPGIRLSDTLSVQDFDDLTIIAGLNVEVDGVKTLKMRLYTPAGYLYREMETAVGSFGEHVYGIDPGKWIEALPEKRDELSVSPGSLVAFRLPVAGTDIVANSLYGEWEIKLYLAEKPMTCLKRFVFRLDP